MTRVADLQHVSYAVHDALAAARPLVAERGAIPMGGETLTDFRYLLLYVGDETAGGYVEFMEPDGEGFLSTFLAKRGEGAHHLTWMVPNLEDAAARAEALGFRIASAHYGFEPWEEVFLAPHPATGCVIQLARSVYDYPTGAEIIERGRPPLSELPATPAGLDTAWAKSLDDVKPGPRLPWSGVTLTSTDAPLVARLFTDVLGGTAAGATYGWPSGIVHLTESEHSGIRSGLGWL